ncbi:MAG: hypothetical protein P1V97_01140 [Planctomycetota bacterium]|nr:hypothetical protein [Planctomycetota bacterium]
MYKERNAGKCWTHGFRFSMVDAIAIAICVVSTVYLYPQIGADALLFSVVLGHFFLFCNVFRVRRNYELIWAALFLVNFVAWRLTGPVDWAAILSCQTPATLIAIIAEIRSPEYHGIFSHSRIPSFEERLDSSS